MNFLSAKSRRGFLAAAVAVIAASAGIFLLGSGGTHAAGPLNPKYQPFTKTDELGGEIPEFPHYTVKIETGTWRPGKIRKSAVKFTSDNSDVLYLPAFGTDDYQCHIEYDADRNRWDCQPSTSTPARGIAIVWPQGAETGKLNHYFRFRPSNSPAVMFAGEGYGITKSLGQPVIIYSKTRNQAMSITTKGSRVEFTRGESARGPVLSMTPNLEYQKPSKMSEPETVTQALPAGWFQIPLAWPPRPVNKLSVLAVENTKGRNRGWSVTETFNLRGEDEGAVVVVAETLPGEQSGLPIPTSLKLRWAGSLAAAEEIKNDAVAVIVAGKTTSLLSPRLVQDEYSFEFTHEKETRGVEEKYKLQLLPNDDNLKKLLDGLHKDVLALYEAGGGVVVETEETKQRKIKAHADNADD